VVLLAGALLGACATVPSREAVAPEAALALQRLEERRLAFEDLRTLAQVEVRREGQVRRLTGVLLLRAPADLRFEALSPFGLPVLLAGATADTLTVWEVPRNRAWLLPAAPEAQGRWLGWGLGPDDAVAILAGHVRPIQDPAVVRLEPAEGQGPVLLLSGARGTQRIWLDPETGQARALEWTGIKHPFRAAFERAAGAGGPLRSLTLTTLDGGLEIRARYQGPRENSGLDPDLLRLSVPESVEIRDFR
jgi:outer membrane lipoprotein-sorting protein